LTKIVLILNGYDKLGIEWMWLLIGNFWQTGIIFLGLLGKILILIKIKGCQNFNAEEKQSLF
jgi:hypothetical protein